MTALLDLFSRRHGWKRAMARWVLALLLATGASLPFTTQLDSGTFLVELRLSSANAARAQLFFDLGRGIREEDSGTTLLRGDGRTHRIRFSIPAGELRALRFDPSDGPGQFELDAARIVSPGGRTVWRIPASDVLPGNEITTAAVPGGVRITTAASATDPQLEFRLPHPLVLRAGAFDRLWRVLPLWSVFLAAGILFPVLIDRVQHRVSLPIGTVERHPIATLALVAGVAVAVQCHPVLFFGRSFVSPDNAVFLLYDHFPTLPGYQSAGLEDGKGSDVAALLHESIHYPGLEWDALVKYHELPLWNRYVMCGAPLLGQGQTMFGSLINLIPMIGRSSSISWDLRFLVTRWLYAFGLGLSVWLLTRQWAASAAIAFCGIFVGFFAYRMNHMAQFSLGVSPWVLVSWLLLRQAGSPRAAAWSLALLTVSSWELIHSGTVKEAYMLLLVTNFAGVLLVAIHGEAWQRRCSRILGALAAGIVLIMLSAPTWLVFLDTLGQSVTHYDHATIRQAAPWQLMGFFEDLFVRELRADEGHILPSANLVVLLGLAWAAGFRDDCRKSAIALGAASAVPLALAFGWIPGSVVAHVPMAATIEHFDNTFGTALLPILSVLGGIGLSRFARNGHRTALWRNLARGTIPLVLLLLVFATGAGGWVGRPFLGTYFAALSVGYAVLLISPSLRSRFQNRGLTTFAIAGALVLLLWRHSEYLRTPFDAYVFNPRIRADWTARSPAIERLRLERQPDRPAGLSYNLFASFSTTYRLETIYGIEPLRNPYYDALTFKGGILKMNWGDARNWHEDDISYLLPLQDMLNVRTYLVGRDQPPDSIRALEKRWQGDLDLYESPHAWPRAFFTAEYLGVDSVDQLLRELKRGFPRPPFAAVSRAEAARLSSSGLRSTRGSVVPARDYTLTMNSTSFTVDAPGPGLVVLTEAYNPDIAVTLDDRPAPLLRVNHAFRGVEVPHAGVFQLRFSYWPKRLTLALWLAACGAGLGLIGFFLVHRGIIPLAGADGSRGTGNPYA